MFHFKFIVYLGLTILSVVQVHAFETCQLPDIETRGINSYTCAVKLKNAETLEFVVSGSSKSNKGASVLVKRAGKTYPIKLDTIPGDEVVSLYVDEIGDSFVLLYEVGDIEGSRSSAAAFLSSNFNPKWKTKLAGFNLEILRNSEFAFVSTIGFVAKLDLKSGKFIWKHDDLFKVGDKSRDFNAGRPIVLETGVVKFGNNQGEDVRISEKTGKLLK